MFVFVPVLPSGLFAKALSTTSVQICIWMALIWSERGTGTAGTSYPPSQACPYLAHGRKTMVFSPFWHHWRAFFRQRIEHRTPISPPPHSLERSCVSSIFRNECSVGVLSQGCLSSHITAEACADRAIVKEERMSGTKRSTQGSLAVEQLFQLWKHCVNQEQLNERAKASFPLPVPSFVLWDVLSDKQHPSP